MKVNQIEVLDNTKEVKHKITGQVGRISIICVGENRRVSYWFQPNMIDKETMSPIKREHCSPEMLVGEKIKVILPLEILGYPATALYVNLTGIVGQLQIHVNNCVHVWLIPTGVNSVGSGFEPVEFSILELTGEKISSDTIQRMDSVKAAAVGSPTPPIKYICS